MQNKPICKCDLSIDQISEYYSHKKENLIMNILKLAKILPLFPLLLLSAMSVSAQNVEGVWVGKVWQASTGAEFNYAMKLEQSGSNAIGQAVIQSVREKYIGEFDISVTIYSNSVHFKDLALTKNTLPYGTLWCIKEGRLNYDPKNNRIYGTIEGYSTSSYGINTPCPKISMDLYKKTDSLKSEEPRPRRESSSWAGNGTGIVIDSRGILATNYHVVEKASEIEVDFGKGDNKRSYTCEVLVADKKNDLALIRINDRRFNGFGTLPYTFKTSTEKPGESVFALGYPKALSELGMEIKYTKGDISALSGYEGDPTTYTLSLSIQPGNSGGPLFDFNGNLIGITNAKIISSDVDNVSYAIKSLYLKNLIDLSSYKITLPTGSSLAGKSITDQIEILSDYVGLIKIR